MELVNEKFTKGPIFIRDEVIEGAVRKKFGFERVSCIDNVFFCARREDNSVSFAVYDMVYIDSEGENPLNCDMIMNQLNKDNGMDGIDELEDGYIVIENHLFRFNLETGGNL